MSLMSVTSSTAYTTDPILTEFTSIAYVLWVKIWKNSTNYFATFCYSIPIFIIYKKRITRFLIYVKNIPWGPLQFGVKPTTNKCALHMFIDKNTEFLQILSLCVQTTFHILTKFIPALYRSKYMHEKLVRYIF